MESLKKRRVPLFMAVEPTHTPLKRRPYLAYTIHPGDACMLRLYHEVEGRYIAVEAVIAHHEFAFIYLTLTSFASM